MQDLLRQIPKIDLLLQDERLQGKDHVADIAREVIEEIREGILSGELHSVPHPVNIVDVILDLHIRQNAKSLRAVINATGIIIHTNLGRSCLSEEAAQAVYEIAKSYSTLEYDVEQKSRGSRLSHIEKELLQLTGAEAVAVVNNNAAAVFLMLSALTKGKEVLVSRGELVEIGGSFRIPDILAESGAKLVEVGTTNKTHDYDYLLAVNENTGAIMAVHTSNYKIIGFTEAVAKTRLVEIAHENNLLALEDLGSGALASLAPFGLTEEPSVLESLKAGMDVISISGDKLLGGPQAGILLGQKELIDKIKKHPLMRALRCDKMTLAALYATLQSYRKGKHLFQIPSLRMLSEDVENVKARAENLQSRLNFPAKIVESKAKVGGGAAPECQIPSYAIAIQNQNVEYLEHFLRHGNTPIIARIANDTLFIDLKAVFEQDIEILANALNSAMEGQYA